MTRLDLPDDDQMVRCVKPSMIQEDGTPDGSEFRLRSGERELSVNWLGAFDQDKTHQLAEVRRVSQLTLRPNGRFAEMNVGMVKCKVAEELDTLRIVSDPLPARGGFDADHSHAAIIGLPQGDSDQGALIGDLKFESSRRSRKTNYRPEISCLEVDVPTQRPH